MTDLFVCKETKVSEFGIVVFPASNQGVQPALGWARPAGGVSYSSYIEQHIETDTVVSLVMSTENNNVDNNLNNDNLYDESSFHPWEQVIRDRSTCTPNLYDVQQTLKSENRGTINRKYIAHALHSRKLLCQTKVIQISSNLKYISIQFHTSMLMETFCTNPLTIKNFSLTFRPDFSKQPTRYNEPETISFLNVPSEADEDSMTQFVQQYAVVIGKPRYPVETINDIKYLTGARIYRVHSRREHIPRIVKLFGRQIQCIYTQQPEQQEWLQWKKHEQERQNNNFLNSGDDTKSGSPTDTETDNESDHQNTDSDIEKTQDNQKHIEKQHNSENNID